MPEDAPDGVWVVPTEMGRRDVAWEGFALLMAGLAVYWWWSVPALRDLTIWPAIPLLALLAIWMLTGEGAADLKFVGAIAGPMRARFGQRRAHEWVIVYARYFRAGPWPRFRHLMMIKGMTGWKRLCSIHARIWR